MDRGGHPGTIDCGVSRDISAVRFETIIHPRISLKALLFNFNGALLVQTVFMMYKPPDDRSSCVQCNAE